MHENGVLPTLPIASVVIPAHDEEQVIGRVLSRMLEDAPQGALEIFVVANGCRDRTAAVARSFAPDVSVLELGQPGKASALNAGDAEAAVFPRFFVDADVELSFGSIAETVAAMQGTGAMVAAPRIELDVAVLPPAVRAYYRVWSSLPYARVAPVGVGVFALSETGRRRFDSFPTLIADDLFVRDLFASSERLCVPTATFTIHPPQDLRSLIDVQTRARLGNLQLRRAMRRTRAPGAERVGSSWVRRRLSALLADPGLWPALPTYAFVQAVARWRARRRLARGDLSWLRDQTSRVAVRPVGADS